MNRSRVDAIIEIEFHEIDRQSPIMMKHFWNDVRIPVTWVRLKLVEPRPQEILTQAWEYAYVFDFSGFSEKDASHMMQAQEFFEKFEEWQAKQNRTAKLVAFVYGELLVLVGPEKEHVRSNNGHTKVEVAYA
jgi:hypothetical protein